MAARVGEKETKRKRKDAGKMKKMGGRLTRMHNQNRAASWSKQLAKYTIVRDQPNSRKKMHDFTAEFLKCVKFHEKFTERVLQIHGPHRHYFKVLRQTKKFQNNEYLLHYKSKLKSQCQLLSAEVRHIANSNIHTKAADKTLELL